MALTLALPLLTILAWIVVFFLAGRVVTWAWNNSIVPIFRKPEINQTQGLALFTLVFMLLGFWRL